MDKMIGEFNNNSISINSSTYNNKMYFIDL